MDPELFRGVLGSYPTGVTLVTALDERGEPFGLTVNSFTSVSLDPPLILVCIDGLASSHDPLVEANVFAVSILAADQHAVASRFAHEPAEDRFGGLAWDPTELGVPVLRGAAAWLACRMHGVHSAGDHSIVLGEVVALDGTDAEPLAFHRGRYGVFSP